MLVQIFLIIFKLGRICLWQLELTLVNQLFPHRGFEARSLKYILYPAMWNDVHSSLLHYVSHSSLSSNISEIKMRLLKYLAFSGHLYADNSNGCKCPVENLKRKNSHNFILTLYISSLNPTKKNTAIEEDHVIAGGLWT